MRLVFAVPGSPLDPRAAGTNRLLKDGAILVTEAADVVDALSPLAGGLPRLPLLPLEEPFSGPATEEPSETERERILEALGPVPVDLDDLIAFTGATPGAVQLVILELDLAGRIERHSGGRISFLA